MSKRLDDLSRNLASGMSRRRALQIFAGGLAAAAFGRSAVGAEAAGSGQAVADFCKAICTPYFPGNGTRGLSNNYFFGNYYGNFTSYGQCMSSCHSCAAGTPNPCGPDICVQYGFAGQPLSVACLPA